MKRTLFGIFGAVLVFGFSNAFAYTPSVVDYSILNNVSQKIIDKYPSNTLGSIANSLYPISVSYESQGNHRIAWILEQLVVFLDGQATSYYASLDQTSSYYFVYDTKTDTYVAEIPVLKLRISIPPEHQLRQPCMYDGCQNLFNELINIGLVVENNVVRGDEGILFVHDKSWNSNLLSVVKTQIGFAGKDSCDLISLLSNSFMNEGSHWKTYTFDQELFENSSHYVEEENQGGRFEYCGDWDNQIWYNKDFADRYIEAQISFHGLGLMNGGIVVEFIE